MEDPELDRIKNTDLGTIMDLSEKEFKIWVFFSFQNIRRRLNWHTVLLLLILGAILGTGLL